MAKGLSDKERQFAAYYVGPARFNASAAARYIGAHPGEGSRLRKKPEVAAEVERLCQQMCDRWLVSSQRWLAEVLSLAMSDPTEVLPEDGAMDVGSVKQLPPQVRAAIRELTVKPDGTVTVKMHPKEGPLRMLGEYIGTLKRQGLTPAGDPPPEADDDEGGVLLGLRMIGPGATVDTRPEGSNGKEGQ